METMFGFASLVMTTILALFLALALHWLLLKATFTLMQPATAGRRKAFPSPLEQGARLTAQAYAAMRK